MNNVLGWEQGMHIKLRSKLRRFKMKGNGDIRKYMINGQNSDHKPTLPVPPKLKRQDSEDAKHKRKQLKMTHLFTSPSISEALLPVSL